MSSANFSVQIVFFARSKHSVFGVIAATNAKDATTQSKTLILRENIFLLKLEIAKVKKVKCLVESENYLKECFFGKS